MKEMNYKFGTSMKIFAFTTENIAGYFPLFEFGNKKILTVCGSGDQMINAYLLDADHVVNFDKNPNALHFAELKFAALRRLSFYDFCGFFFKGDTALSKTTFDSFKCDLSTNARSFFTCLFKGGKQGNDIRNSDIFYTRHDIKSNKIKYNLYINEHQYINAKRIIEKKVMQGNHPQFIDTPLHELSGLKMKFDLILLSNIADYSEYMFPGAGHARKFTEQLIFPLKKILEKKGKIVAAYIYGTNNRKPPNEFNEESKRRKAFETPELTYHEKTFQGVSNKEGRNDMAVVLTMRSE
jgi:hypothetical protein